MLTRRQCLALTAMNSTLVVAFAALAVLHAVASDYWVAAIWGFAAVMAVGSVVFNVLTFRHAPKGG